MPTRILREGIITSEKINALSERAELFYRRLMSVADDYGRYFAHPSILRATCYPLKLDSVSEKDVKQMLSECVALEIIMLYGSEKYLLIKDFKQQTRSNSKFPEPVDNELLIKCKSGDEADAKQMLSLGVVGGEGGDGSRKANFFPLPEKFSANVELSNAWIEFQERYRKKTRLPMAEGTRDRHFQELEQWGEQRFLNALLYSIDNGYQGIFERNGHSNGHAKKRSAI